MISVKLFCFVAIYLAGVSGLTCFSCKGITHPRFCDYVETCGDGEYCSFIKNSKTSGGTIYNLGCASNTTCTTRRSLEHEECHTCCKHNVCNDAGCGEQGHVRNMGPLCYKCSGVTSMTECDTITTCPSDELCIIESNDRNGEKYFNSGCQTKHACNVISGPSHIFGKRGINNTQEAHSKRCCAKDLCNAQYAIDLMTTTSIPVPKTTSDSTGMLFYLAFMQTYTYNPKYTQLYIISNQNGNCRIRIPYLNIDSSVAVTVYNVTLYRINSSIIMTTTGIQKKAILVSCDVPVSIYGMNYANAVTEGYLGIPYSGLGCRYIVPSISSTDISEFGLVATSDNTFVSISLRLQSRGFFYNGESYRSGKTLNITISKNETFFLQLYRSDLSGTIISSTKPIAVVSGCSLSFMNNKYSNHMAEMILPHKHLGRHYIVPVLYNSQCNYRVYADSSLNFTVLHGNSSQTEIKHLTTGQFIEVTNYQPSSISSSTGILVQLYCDTYGNSDDSVMVTLPAIQHFKASYKFVAVSDFPPGYQPHYYYITVIIQTDAIDGLQFDGVSSLSFIQTTSIGMSGQSFTILIKEISKGLHTITQVHNVPFGLIINGKTKRQGYAYPAGFLFNTGV